jgi:glycine betaine/choline ABC-type transport system substrate-binding protein
VRARDETAQQLLGAMVVHLLRERGYPVVDEVGKLSAAAVVERVEQGEADVVVALLGDMLTLQNSTPITTLPTDLPAALALIQDLQSGHDLETLPPAPFSLTPVLLVDEDLAGLGVTTLSRLATYMNAYNSPFSLCVDSNFFSHPVTGLSELERFYGFHFEPNKIHLMDEDSIFTAIQERQCQVTVGTMTDGRVAAWRLLPLRDDLGFFPLNNPLIVTRHSLLSRQFGLRAPLTRLFPALDATTIQQLTTRIELGADGLYLSGDEESAAQVARAFLLEQQLLVSAAPTSGVVSVTRLDGEQLQVFEELPGLSGSEQSDE